MIINSAQASDCEKLRELSERSFVSAYERYNTEEDMRLYLSQNFTPEKIAGELADPKLHYLVARDPEIVALAKLDLEAELKDVTGKSLEILRLYTSPDLIGRGIGKMMIEAVASFARENGFDNIFLGVWQRNEAAIRFYKREGFVISGTTTFTLGEDVQQDFIMLREP